MRDIRHVLGAIPVSAYERATAKGWFARHWTNLRTASLCIFFGAGSYAAGAWRGRNTEDLTLAEAQRVVLVAHNPEHQVVSASGRLYVIAKGAIESLQKAREHGGKVTTQVDVWLEKLQQQTQRRGD